MDLKEKLPDSYSHIDETLDSAKLILSEASDKINFALSRVSSICEYESGSFSFKSISIT